MDKKTFYKQAHAGLMAAERRIPGHPMLSHMHKAVSFIHARVDHPNLTTSYLTDLLEAFAISLGNAAQPIDAKPARNSLDALKVWDSRILPNPDMISITECWLQENGFQGLCNLECCCDCAREDIGVCDCIDAQNCQAAYAQPLAHNHFKSVYGIDKPQPQESTAHA
jgi:hypothetical protein